MSVKKKLLDKKKFYLFCLSCLGRVPVYLEGLLACLLDVAVADFVYNLDGD